MEKICVQSGERFAVSEADVEFYRQFGVPAPSMSVRERLRRRMMHRNFRNLYRRSCSGTGKQIISMYDADAPFPVYDAQYWWSDQWDAQTFGREYDFSRPFFVQYAALKAAVPHMSIMNSKSENCWFSNFAFESKNCYLVFGCVRNEDCLYGHIVWQSEKCMDNLYIYECKWCSNSIDLVGCYDVHYSTECVNCQESYFLHDCQNCQSCFGCTNLRKRSYCLFNEQLTRKAYEKRMAELLPLSTAKVDELNRWLAGEKAGRAVYPPAFASQAEEITGDHLYFCHNLTHCFDVKRSEDASYCFTVYDAVQARDLCFGSGRFSVECMAVLNCEEMLCSHMCTDSHNLAYSEFCYASHDLFGCNGLRRAEYCILNKQYKKDEYHALRRRIIEQMRESGEWGEFFPAGLSPFAYNESVAQEYLPLDNEQVLARSLPWKSSLDCPRHAAALSPAAPPAIDEASPDCVERTYVCAETCKPYKITAAEYDFCRRTGIPLPMLCPDVRHLRRMAMRMPRELWERTCACCGTGFRAAYPPAAPARVLCKECYQRALEAPDTQDGITRQSAP